MSWTDTWVQAAASLGLVMVTADVSAADSWDRSLPNDGGVGTRSELVHGSDELHDLQGKNGKPDEDWYRISQQPYASYEIVVEATAGEISPPLLERIAADGTTVVQSSTGIGALGFTRSLRWTNPGAAAIEDQFVRVRSGACAKCKKDALYRIRAFETTYRLPRFNNVGTQVTVVVVQNPGATTVSGNLYFWLANGTLAATQPLTIGAKELAVFASQTVVPGVSGSVTFAHDGRYGDLAGKGIALEPATGFAFDTAFEARPK